MTDTLKQEELTQELARVNEQLDALKHEQQRVKKAAELLGHSIRRLCVQEMERNGCDQRLDQRRETYDEARGHNLVAVSGSAESKARRRAKCKAGV